MLAPSYGLSGDLAKRMTQLSFLDPEDFDQMELGGVMLIDHTADQPLRSPLTFLQDRDGPATTL